MTRILQKIMVVSLLLAMAGQTEARKYPDESDDGLMRVDVKNIDAAYWREGATLADYDKVMIDDVEVSFRKNWQRDQNRDRRGANNRITSEDMEKIRAAVAEGFVEVFVEELKKAGYEVVESPGDTVLALEPSIIDLNVTSPDIGMRQAGIQRTYTTSAGEMTLNMALFDSGSNSIIGRMIDRRRAMDTGQLRYSNQVTNRHEANIMYQSWAKSLIRSLDEAKKR